MRGRFGAGVSIIPTKEKKEIKNIRTTYNATDVLFSKEFYDVAKQPGAIMGHARFPTSGGIKSEDLHPHEVGDILGMHNGTLTEIAGVKVAKNENDSRLLFTMINNNGVLETFKSVKGSYACTWVNKKEKTLNFFRNNSRGLYIGCLEGTENTIFWASELEMLEFVLSRHLPFTNTRMKANPITASTLISFKLYNKNYLQEPIIEYLELEPKTAQQVLPPSNYYSSASGTRYKTFGAHSVDFQTLQDLLREGCCKCKKKMGMVDYHSRGEVTWKTSTAFECRQCNLPTSELNDPMPMLC